MLLRRVAPQGFAFGELVYLRSCSKCSFLLSSPRLFFFSPSRIFTGLPRLPTFYGAPPPPDFLRGTPASRLFTGLPRLPTLYFMIQTIQGVLKIALHFFRGLSKLWPGDTFCTQESAVSHIPLKSLILKSTPPFFDPLCIGLAKTALRIFSR